MAETQPGRNGGTLNKGRDVPGPGRPRRLVSSVVKDLNDIGIAEVTNVEVNAAYKTLLNCTAAELKKMAQDDEQPFLIRSVAKQMLSGKGQEMIDKMLERAHGKPAGVFQVQTNGTETAGASTGSTTTIAGINIIVMGNDKPITSEDDLPDE